MTTHDDSNRPDDLPDQGDQLDFLHNLGSLGQLRETVGELTVGEQIAVELTRFVVDLPDDQKARFDRECPSLVERILNATTPSTQTDDLAEAVRQGRI